MKKIMAVAALVALVGLTYGLAQGEGEIMAQDEVSPEAGPPNCDDPPAQFLRVTLTRDDGGSCVIADPERAKINAPNHPDPNQVLWVAVEADGKRYRWTIQNDQSKQEGTNFFPGQRRITCNQAHRCVPSRPPVGNPAPGDAWGYSIELYDCETQAVLCTADPYVDFGP